MAERTTAGRHHDPEHFNLDATPGIDLTINICQKCSHQSTNNSATGSHARNIHVMDCGSNNHVGNDCHDGAMAISGTSMVLPMYMYMYMYVGNLTDQNVTYYSSRAMLGPRHGKHARAPGELSAIGTHTASEPDRQPLVI